MWNEFWEWYDKHTTRNLFITAIIVYLQIPHMWWAGDLYLQFGIISNVNPFIDFFLYGIDLIEIILMIKVGMMIYGRIRNSRDKK